MGIITKTGDDGQSRWQGHVVAKNSALLECVGTLDELQAYLGLLKFQAKKYQDLLHLIQTTLWSISGELAYQTNYPNIKSDITSLEDFIHRYEPTLPVLKNFLIPGASPPEALAHVCRTVARRAERTLVTLSQTQTINPDFLVYLNRLSDLLFILARLCVPQSP